MSASSRAYFDDWQREEAAICAQSPRSLYEIKRGNNDMGTIAKNNDGEFELCPAGTHLALCYIVADCGLQTNKYNPDGRPQHKIALVWELPHKTMKDGQPFAISSLYTLSLSSKATLRKDLESWRSRAFTDTELSGFDIRNVLGKPCMLSIVHNPSGDKTYANINAVAAIPKGIEVPKLTNAPVYYDMDAHDKRAYAALPKWIQKKIAESVQQEETVSAGGPSTYFDDDIPF